MPDYLFTAHTKDMLKERDILEDWVLETIRNPDVKNSGNDGNIHYFKSLSEHGNRMLYVVVNETIEPNRIITLFLDRRRRAE